ncbi:MAG: DUF4837 family protein [Salinivirgaceae bacterium]|nr:DUF4837 family protein [Salinivirgaceae bacterium]
MKISHLLPLLAIVLASCTKKDMQNKLLPEIGGKAGEVVVVIEDDAWASAIGDTIRGLFNDDVPGLPQSEPMFDVARIPSKAFTDIFMRHRNVFIVNVKANQHSHLEVRRDVWARPQMLVELTAPSIDSANIVFLENAERILGIFQFAEQERIVTNYTNFPDRTVMAKLKERVGIDMIVPKGYTFDMDTNNFIWISHETPELSQGIFIYYYDYNTELQFSRDSLIAKRDQMLKRYVAGPAKGSYMTTIPIDDVTTFRSYNIRGKYTAELRGMWSVKGDFMGGPFVSFSQVDHKRQLIVCADGYVYYPSRNKRNYMRQVEAIMQTMQFVEKQ